MTRLNIMTILTADFHFWLFSCLLIIALLLLLLINWLLKPISKPAEALKTQFFYHPVFGRKAAFVSIYVSVVTYKAK
ncbi:hypothetical protein OQX61_11320 [Pedobacter sp. PLR]|uniref:hypothetical protein n=1 Tax=Pedobacter sp. PLR TaxID=2994465 RepID=UPI0022479915|nr:hypothetical protein [Pedobacter sp. PLR]MCX2451850.1 hypothetical protein [Pedobacter sp. PLR]